MHPGRRATHTRPAHTARRQRAKCRSRLAIHPAIRSPNSGDRRRQPSRAHSRPARDAPSSPSSRVLNSGVCERARELPPCRSASRAGTRAPSPGRAGRWPPAGGSAAAAGTGAPSAPGGPGRAAGRGLRHPVRLRRRSLLWAARPAAGAGLIGERGRGGAEHGRPWDPGSTRSREVGANPEPGSVLPRSHPCASWDLLTAPGSPTGETEAQRARLVPLQRGRPQESVWGTREA